MLSWKKSKFLAETKVKGKGEDLRNNFKVAKKSLEL